MESNSKPMRLGQILIKVGLLTPDELTEAMRVAEDTGLPVGRVLVMSGYIRDDALKAAVQVQSLIKDKIVDLEIGLKAVRMVAD